MAMSMTGYGSDVLQIEETTITIEIRSVNHRFLDISPKLPRSFLFLEDQLKKIIHSYLKRGRVDLFIEISGENFVQKTLKTDWDLIDQYMAAAEKVKRRYQLIENLSLSTITNNQDLFWVEEKKEQPVELKDRIIESVHRACEKVVAMRQEEGAYLLNDIKSRMDSIQRTVNLLDKRRNDVINEYRLRIAKRIEDYLNNEVDIDQNRLHQEIAVLVEKGDITEEITRLASHLKHFNETLQESSPIGRKLDFIIQEMQREINTIGAKSSDCKISEWTVHLKSNIEKIKEQVQNIE